MDFLEFPETAKKILSFTNTLQIDDWAVLGMIAFTLILLWINRDTSKSKLEEVSSANRVSKKSELKPDLATIDKAIDHVAEFLNPEIDFSNYSMRKDFYPPCKLITEKLRSGELVAKGKRAGTTMDCNSIIDKKEWKYRELKPESAMVNSGESAQTFSKGSGEDHIQFAVLKVDLNKAKKLWPLENI